MHILTEHGNLPHKAKCNLFLCVILSLHLIYNPVRIVSNLCADMVCRHIDTHRQTPCLLINPSSSFEQHVLAALGLAGLLSKAVSDYREFLHEGNLSLL